MTTVIHHSADFDGLFSREIARKFLPDAKLIGWDYGNDLVPEPNETYYIIDLSPECVKPLSSLGHNLSKLIWIDHHKSAIEKFATDIPGYRIDGVAACRLAWQWFSIAEHNAQNQTNEALQIPLPDKNAYISREVSEPYAVQLAGEYDIWDKRNPDVDVFQMGLRARELTPFDWSELLSANIKPSIEEIESLISVGHTNLLNPDGTTNRPIIHELLEKGRLLQDYTNRRDSAITNALSFVVEFEGLKFLALNSATKGSMQFAVKDVPETGHDALLKFNYTGKHWDVSLYHANHRRDLDLSLIAVKHGGGGHRGACGFRTGKLPFV